MNKMTKVIETVMSNLDIQIDVCRATLCCGETNVLLNTADKVLEKTILKFVKDYISPPVYEVFIAEDIHLNGRLRLEEYDGDFHFIFDWGDDKLEVIFYQSDQSLWDEWLTEEY